METTIFTVCLILICLTLLSLSFYLYFFTRERARARREDRRARFGWAGLLAAGALALTILVPAGGRAVWGLAFRCAERDDNTGVCSIFHSEVKPTCEDNTYGSDFDRINWNPEGEQKNYHSLQKDSDRPRQESADSLMISNQSSLEEQTTESR